MHWPMRSQTLPELVNGCPRDERNDSFRRLRAMSKGGRSPVAVLTASAAVYCLWVADQGWQAHLTLGESHGPFGVRSCLARSRLGKLP